MSNVDLVSMPDKGSRCICCGITESDELDFYLVLDQRQWFRSTAQGLLVLQHKGKGHHFRTYEDLLSHEFLWSARLIS